MNKFHFKRYDFDSYDRHFSLRPPWLLVVAIAFLCRVVLIRLVVGVSSFGGAAGNMTFLTESRSLTVIAAAVPGMLVFVALLSRLPSAPRVIRMIWRYGQLLLAGSAASQILLFLASLDFRWSNAANDSVASLSMALIDFGILLYVLVSSRVKDTFADFPEPELTDSSTSKAKVGSP